jgi:hypothetical protein
MARIDENRSRPVPHGHAVHVPHVREAVARTLDPAAIRWISWSHFEVDECGALDDWLAIVPHAQAACSQVGALVNLEDFAACTPCGLARDVLIDTGTFIPCAVWPEDDLVASRLRGDFSGVSGTREILTATSASRLQRLPAMRVRLIVSGKRGDTGQVIGEYGSSMAMR